MKRISKRRKAAGAVVMAAVVLAGCGRTAQEDLNDNVLSDNIIITETGEVMRQEPEIAGESVDLDKIKEEVGKQAQEEIPDTSQKVISEVQLTEPVQKQVITGEDQTAPSGNSTLQIVFLGDSIFDNSRDGTGVPYLTAEQCGADVYNLAIGGTSATLEVGEHAESELWTSRSLVGVVKALNGEIGTEVFEGTRTKEILDNKEIDWSDTDYFVVEYGLNDFFRGVPLSDSENEFNLFTYVGALRYAVSNLGSLAPGATVILCTPNYAQFYDGDWMIGDGNTVNTGYGTLFDYKGICQYVANESQVPCFDAYLDLGINGYTAEEYLEDGVHLTEAGRRLYADKLAHMILNYEETKNN